MTVTISLINNSKLKYTFNNHLGKVRFFLGVEGWGILVFFSQKIVGPPLRFNKKTSDPPPPPPPLGD